MKVEECMSRRVIACRPDTDMQEAAHLLWEHDCGCLPVVNDKDEVVGMVTDRDLCMGSYTSGRALHALPVRDSMSKELFTCRPLDTLEQAIQTMSDHQVRRLPVVGERGELVGILSLNDLVRRIVRLHDQRARATLSARLLEAQASICETRGAGLPETVRGPLPQTNVGERVVSLGS